MIGRTLAHYQLIEKLGEGGMGVVYKARDTHLDRFVALKVLPTEKLSDSERKRRFIQEAKAASALNHPNIVHIYDIAESEGVPFIAMEYVPGKPLDQVIARRALALSETLKYAIQVADALAKAHAAGIIHRDIKPANMIVTDDGLIKILDFGLAKLTESTAPESSDRAATISHMDYSRSGEGMIVGTVAYMSPEQGEGKKVDQRSDIFSFGSVLYEMATGRRAFQAESNVGTLAAVLREEPKPLSEIGENLPRELERVVSRCLRKNPERRWQTMSDLKVALEDLKEESESGTRAPEQVVTRPATGTRQWLPWALLAVVIIAGAAVYALMDRRPPPAAPVLLRGIPLTAYPGREFNPSLSPDGHQVAFRWDGEDGKFHIYVKLIGPGRPLRLTNDTRLEHGPAWSPDGKFIAFYRQTAPARLALMLVPALGGSERTLVEFDIQPVVVFKPAWSADSKWLVISARIKGAERNALYRCSADMGDMVRLTEPPVAARHGDDAPAVSFDGRTLAFVRFASSVSQELHVLSLSPNGNTNGAPRRIDTGTFTVGWVAWTADNREIIFNTVERRPVLCRVRADGSAKPSMLGIPESAQPAIAARGGRLVYTESHADTNIWMADLDQPDHLAGPPRKTLGASFLREVNPHVSPDGKKMAFSSNRSGNHEIWTSDIDGRDASQLTFEGATTAGAPHWSPDGQWVAFDSNLTKTYNIYVVRADGGKAKRLTSEGTNIVPSWSPDGKRIYFGSDRTGRFEVWSMTPEGEDPRQLTHGGGFGPAVSPDGETVYYTRGERETTLLKIPVAGGVETKVVDGLHRYNFVPSRKGIYFCAAGQGVILKFLDFATGRTTDLFTGEEPVDLGLALSPNGRQIFFAKVDDFQSDLQMVENFR